MGVNYTSNIGFANPDPGECNWDNDWWRNQYISDILLKVSNSTNRIIEGGEISLTGGLNISISSGSANIGGGLVSWDETTTSVVNADVDEEYLSNWIYVDSDGVLVVSQVPPTGDFVALGVLDTDFTAIIRQYDLRSFAPDASIIPSIEKILSDPDIVDAFLYDTSKDSDVGLWRLKSKWTSYYNEPLNTSIRGNRKEFPKDNLIIFKLSGMYIYDLTTSYTPLWRFFGISSTNGNYGVFRGLTSYSIKKGYAKNGVISVCLNGNFNNGNEGLHGFNFIDDYAFKCDTTEAFSGKVSPLISYINTDITGYSMSTIAGRLANGVAMTVLDGNDYPTIAVATGGGVSVINGPSGKGTSVNSGSTATFNHVAFMDNGNLLAVLSSSVAYYTDYSSGPFYTLEVYNSSDAPRLFEGTIEGLSKKGIGDSEGLILTEYDNVVPLNSLFNKITDSYQSGWYDGNTVLAIAGDNVVEDVGLDTTTELLTNSDFDSDLSGWTDSSQGTGTASWFTGGFALLTRGTGYTNSGRISQTITTEEGGNYKIILQNDSTSTGNLALNIDNVFIASVPPNESKEITFVASASTTSIGVYNGTDSSNVYADSISVKRDQNLVENGEFSSDRAWTLGTGVSISNGLLSWDGSQTSYTTASQSGVVEVGKIYVVKYEVSGFSSGSVGVNAGGSTTVYVSANGSHSNIIIPVTDSTVKVVGSDTFIGSVDNVEVYELDIPDYTGSGNDGRVVGQLSKSLVDVGCDLTAFSGFSSDENYIKFEDTTDFQVGTGNFFVSAWVKDTSVQNDYLFERNDPSRSGETINLLLLATGEVRASCTSNSIDSSRQIRDGKWHHILFMRNGTTISLYIDGNLEGTATAANDLTNADAIITIGVSTSFTSALGSGYVANVKFSNEDLTETQIKSIYESERRLIQPNAKAVLTYPQATCIDYSSDSDELAVGVTDGSTNHAVDTFQGLVKIKTDLVDTVPVAVSITENSFVVVEETQVNYKRDEISLL